MRYSRRREMIYRYVCEQGNHPNAQTVYEALRVYEPKLSLGTVYRNLNQLADAGKLKKISLPDGNCRFDGTLSRHSHIVCECCGRTTDFSASTEPLRTTIKQETGYSLTQASLALYGICSACTEALQSGSYSFPQN